MGPKVGSKLRGDTCSALHTATPDWHGGRLSYANPSIMKVIYILACLSEVHGLLIGVPELAPTCSSSRPWRSSFLFPRLSEIGHLRMPPSRKQ